VRELVAGPDDEILERVVWIEVRIQEQAVFRSAVFGRAPLEGEGRVIEDVFDIVDLAEEMLGRIVDERRVVERQPVFEVGVRDLDV
jgi:hypothetical protein